MRLFVLLGLMALCVLSAAITVVAYLISPTLIVVYVAILIAMILAVSRRAS